MRGGFLSYGDTPSYHPFVEGFSNIKPANWGLPFHGNPQVEDVMTQAHNFDAAPNNKEESSNTHHAIDLICTREADSAADSAGHPVFQ